MKEGIGLFKYEVDDHIYLALLEVRHAADLFHLIQSSKQHIREWLTFADATQKVDDAQEYIERTLKRFAANDGFSCGIWHKGVLVGAIFLLYIDWANKKTEIGYWLSQEHQGSGIMTKSCKALINYVFDELKLNRVEIKAAEGNIKSRAIPERLGFQQEGILRQSVWLYDKYVDNVVYGMLSYDWKGPEENG
jgi:ribosomal-protein-serine acetyltransferase